MMLEPQQTRLCCTAISPTLHGPAPGSTMASYQVQFHVHQMSKLGKLPADLRVAHKGSLTDDVPISMHPPSRCPGVIFQGLCSIAQQQLQIMVAEQAASPIFMPICRAPFTISCAVEPCHASCLWFCGLKHISAGLPSAAVSNVRSPLVQAIPRDYAGDALQSCEDFTRCCSHAPACGTPQAWHAASWASPAITDV